MDLVYYSFTSQFNERYWFSCLALLHWLFRYLACIHLTVMCSRWHTWFPRLLKGDGKITQHCLKALEVSYITFGGPNVCAREVGKCKRSHTFWSSNLTFQNLFYRNISTSNLSLCANMLIADSIVFSRQV